MAFNGRKSGFMSDLRPFFCGRKMRVMTVSDNKMGIKPVHRL